MKNHSKLPQMKNIVCEIKYIPDMLKKKKTRFDIPLETSVNLKTYP
jgi:hypothetical protein